ncbi:MAG: DUF2726 domain-containing protein [Verrucomicrobiota bacterium]
MQPIAILVAAALVLFFVWVVVRAQLAGRRNGAASYYLRKSLFTPAERVFLAALERAVPDGVRVFGKVRLEDIFGVTRGLDRVERLAARNQINRKHVDFLLVSETDLAPLAGIEFDDSSHEKEDRRQRDAFVDSVFASAGLPLLHMPAQPSCSHAELKARLADLLFKRK